MKWILNFDRKLVPILLGVTTLSCVSLAILLYPIFQKDDDTKKTWKSRRIVTSKGTTIQCKIPRHVISAVIGRDGSVIKDIQDKTGTHINMNDKDMKSPDCVCIIRGNEMESIRLAESMINNIIDNQPVIEIDEIFVPYETWGKYIRKHRDALRILQFNSRAKIIIENGSHKFGTEWKRRITLKGTPLQIARAKYDIEDILRAENETQAKLEEKLKEIEKLLPRFKSSSSNNNVKDIIKDQSIQTMEIKNIFLKENGYQAELEVTEATKMSDSEPSSCNNDINTSDDVLELSKISLPEDDFIEVNVSATHNPHHFWIHIIGPGNIALNKLMSEMMKYYNREENRELHALKKIISGQMVAVKFSKRWYRSKIISIVNEHECIVFFVDYGGSYKVSTNEILELRTDMLCLRLQAVECSLADVKPRESEWSFDACMKFNELIGLMKWKPLVAKIRGYKKCPVRYGGSGREGSPIPYLDLYDKLSDKSFDIGEVLVYSGYAEYEEHYSAAGITSMRNAPSFR